MATLTIIRCDRCGVDNSKQNEFMRSVSLDATRYDVCRGCYDTVERVMQNNTPMNIRLGIDAIEKMQELAGGTEQLDENTHLATDAVLEALVTLEEHAAK